MAQRKSIAGLNYLGLSSIGKVTRINPELQNAIGERVKRAKFQLE